MIKFEENRNRFDFIARNLFESGNKALTKSSINTKVINSLEKQLEITIEKEVDLITENFFGFLKSIKTLSLSDNLKNIYVKQTSIHTQIIHSKEVMTSSITLKLDFKETPSKNDSDLRAVIDFISTNLIA